MVVDSSSKKVQHPTGGIVGQVNVKDGDHVEAGDLLVRLDDTITKANLAIAAFVKAIPKVSEEDYRTWSMAPHQRPCADRILATTFNASCRSRTSDTKNPANRFLRGRR